MPNHAQLLSEIERAAAGDASVNPFAAVRLRYLKLLHGHTNRNVIAYYSAFLQKPKASDTHVNDKDKLGFMLTIHGMDRTKGLDLMMHTPGGDLAATESLVDYLWSMFGRDVRVIVPQICMSAGTMIALSGKSIVMGKQSNLGPIDPQLNGIACQAIVEEFEEAKRDILRNPQLAGLWQPIISRYQPTLIGACRRAIDWSEEMVEKWLKLNMCAERQGTVSSIVNSFADHSNQKSHNRHISKTDCERFGLNIESLESDTALQDIVLSLHHCFMHTFYSTPAAKIIENHWGENFTERVAI